MSISPPASGVQMVKTINGDRELTCIEAGETLRPLQIFSSPHLSSSGSIRSTLLGKVLRIDVENNDDGTPYSIPSDNPFVWEKNSRPGKSESVFCICERRRLPRVALQII